MAVAEGRNGSITLATTDGTKITVAEQGTWSIGGISRNMIDITAFGDTVMKYAPGMMNAGTITFSGFCDAKSTAQNALINALNNGKFVGNACNGTGNARGCSTMVKKLRMWANDDATFPEYGFWSAVGSTGKLFFNSMDVGQDKNGVGTITFTAQVSHGVLAWSTTT